MLTAEENQLLTRTSANSPMGQYFRRFWQPVALSIDLRAIDQLDDRRVDVPQLIGFTGAYPFLRSPGVNPSARPTPASLAHQLIPGCRCDEDTADALGEDSQTPGRVMPVLGRLDHSLDGYELFGGQPRRREPRRDEPVLAYRAGPEAHPRELHFR